MRDASSNKIIWLKQAVMLSLVVFVLAVVSFALTACGGNDANIKTADFGSADGWALTQASGDLTLDDFVFENNQVIFEPRLLVGANDAISIGQPLNLSRNSYYEIRVVARFYANNATGAHTQPRLRLRVGGSDENISMVETGTRTAHQTHMISYSTVTNAHAIPNVNTPIVLVFNSGSHTNPYLEIMIGRVSGTLAGSLRISGFEARRVSQDEVRETSRVVGGVEQLGRDGRSLDRAKLNGRNNLLEPLIDLANDIDRLPQSTVTGELPYEWTAHGDITTSLYRHHGQGVDLYRIVMTLDEQGSGFISNTVSVQRGRYYRFTFSYRIPNTLVQTSEISLANRIGLFASLNGHQRDILSREGADRNRFNFANATPGTQLRHSEPIFFYSRGDTLDITLNLGLAGSEVRGTVYIFNIMLEEVGVTALPTFEPFVQRDSRPIGFVIAWVVIAVIITIVVIAGAIIGIKFYTSRRRTQGNSNT
ncbi:MAG: hypothetical protein FWC80_07220 [Firmicutes bacterium]|nr:hypothetical protein [Bacillota bacterium]